MADPQTLYDRPANRFAASMCGSPGMNFLDGRVTVSDGRCTMVLSGEVVLSLPDECREVLASYAGKPMTLGVRPEHLDRYSILNTQYSAHARYSRHDRRRRAIRRRRPTFT